MADIAQQSWSFLRQKVSWSELNDWSHRLADRRLLLAYTRSQLRSRSGRITVLWEMASLVLVSVASWCHKIPCSCFLIRPTVLNIQIKNYRLEQEEYNEITKAAALNFLSSISFWAPYVGYAYSLPCQSKFSFLISEHWRRFLWAAKFIVLWKEPYCTVLSHGKAPTHRQTLSTDTILDGMIFAENTVLFPLKFHVAQGSPASDPELQTLV